MYSANAEDESITRKQAERLCGKKTDISELKLTYEETKRLCDKNIKNLNDLWRSIGQDFDRGIAMLARETEIDEARLIAYLSAQAIRGAKPGESSWLSRYWIELLLALLSVVIVVLILGTVGLLPFLPLPL